MKRKLAYVGFAFFAGLLASTVGWGKYNLVIIVVFEVIFSALFFLLSQYRIYVTAVAVSFFVGVVYQSAYTHYSYDRIMTYDNKEITFVGTVKDYTYLGSDNGRLTVEGKINNNVNTQITFYVDDDNYGYYDKVEVKGRVTKINDSITSLSENYNRPKSEFLKGSGKIEVKVLEHNTRPVLSAVKRYRDYLFNKINYIVKGEEGGFLGAMLCGDKTQLSNITRTKIYRSGLGHILAVSGIHLSIVTMYLSVIIYSLIRNRKVRFVFLQIIIWSFALFAGFSPSVTRAAVMMTAILFGDLIFANADTMNTLGWCVLLMPLKNPYIVRDPSFLLSITGTIAMGVIVPYVTKRMNYKGAIGKIFSDITVLIAPVLTSIPVQLMFFDEISLAAPFSNLVLLPLCTFALGLTVVVAATGGLGIIAVPVLKTAGWLIHIVIACSDKISSFRYSYVDITNIKTRSIIAVVCIVAITAILLAKKIRYVMAYSVVAYCIILTVANLSLLSDADVVHYIFIPGNSKCQVLICKNSKCVIADIGATGSKNKTVWKAMTKRGIRTTESVLITSNCYYTAQKYMNILYPQPLVFYGDFDIDNNFYKTENITRFENIMLRKTDYGYESIVNSIVFKLYGSGFSIGEKEYDLKKEQYPVEVVINEKDIEVWRLDYGIDKQHRLG